MPAKPEGLKSEFLFAMKADLEPPLNVGVTPHGTRMIFIVTGGTVEGPKIKGKVLPGGGDWFQLRSDGVGELDVKAAFETDDGHLIYVHYSGIVNSQTEDGSTYFRTTPRFETASEKYGWLNNLIAVGVGTAGENQVSYDVYAIL